MKFIIFTLFLSHLFASGAEKFHLSAKDLSLDETRIQNSAAQTTATEYPPHYNERNPQAKGVILSFHQWPDVKEKKLITDYLKQEGLVKKAEIKRFKVWVFDWPEWRTVAEARRVCENLPNLSFLESCEPDYLVDTATYDKKHLSQGKIQLPQNNVRPEFIQPTISDSQGSGGAESCDVASSQFGLLDSQLSDYWAQEMVGADLLKEELAEADPVEKHLVEVFDVPPTHSVGVRNLISDEGDHSVLPELGDQVGITATPTTVHGLMAANRMLNKVDETCATYLNSPDESSLQQGGDGSDQSSREQGGGGSDQGSSDQGSTDRGVANQQQQGSSNQVIGPSPSQSEIVTHEGNEYIVLRSWANNRHYDLSNIIVKFSNDNELQYIDNPYIDALKAAGESYSPTIHVIPNTESNREKLEQFVKRRGRTVHNRDLTVVWKAGTNWNEAWKTPIEGGGPSKHHDLEADYEVDRDHRQNRPIFAYRNHRYIFRPPVADIAMGGTVGSEHFNWLPPIVLGPNNKLKIWGTKVIGEEPLTINGVSVTLTEVPGTFSSVSGSGWIHGKFEVVLTSEQYNQILAGGQSSNTDSNIMGGSASSVQQQTGKDTSGNVNKNTNPNREQTGGSTQANENDNTNINVKRDTASVPEAQEMITYENTEYILIRDWVNNRGLDIADLIYFLKRENVEILDVRNPYIEKLRAAGKSWSPTVFAITNTGNNRSKLAQFVRERSR